MSAVPEMSDPLDFEGVDLRMRMVTWEDPVATAARGAELSGLAYLRALMAGELPRPPIARLLGFLPVEVSAGRAVFAVVPGEEHYNPIGVVHGGLAATLLDSALGCAVQTTLPAGVGYTSLGLEVKFVRPMTRETGRVLCTAEVVHQGRTVATAEARVKAEATGKLIAHGTASCLIVDRREIAAPVPTPSGNGSAHGQAG